MYLRSALFLPKFPKLLQVPPSPGIAKNAYHHHSSISDDMNLFAETQNEKHIPKQSLLTTFLYSLDNFVSNFLDLPLTPSIDPHHLLSGNFAPVAELPPTACTVVEGSLPSSLDGAYIRNGPNPHFIPRGPYHLFDGDGMLHSVRISGGRATFCSRYVKTYKFQREAEVGHPFFPSPFSSFSGGMSSAAARLLLVVARAISGHFNPVVHGFGTANTSLAFFSGSLYALCESDLPYEIKVTPKGEILTLGRRDLGGGGSDPSVMRMTAHPHCDPDTGEVFAFRCNTSAPFLTFFRIDSAGVKGADLPISSMKRMTCLHDFGLTKRFIVFQDVQVEMDPTEAVRGRSPLVYDGDKVPRIGLLRRDAAEDGGIVWIEAAGLNMLHVINAWEEEEEEEGDSGGKIVILAPNFLSVESGFHNMSLMHSEFEMVTLDIEEKKVVSRKVLSANNMEFGAINQAYVGKKNRYMYASVISGMPKTAGVVKLDLSLATAQGRDCTVASRMYGAGCYGGETYFVAREAQNGSGDHEEDDGYLVTYVHDENSGMSWLWVMDAKSANLEIVARVKLPGRVPYGFHGLFVPDKDLKSL